MIGSKRFDDNLGSGSPGILTHSLLKLPMVNQERAVNIHNRFTAEGFKLKTNLAGDRRSPR